MTLRDQITKVAELYLAVSGQGRTTVSKRVFNRGSRLDEIIGGKDLATRIFERAMQWFSDNWPDGAAWPADVPRPAVQTVEVAQ